MSKIVISVNELYNNIELKFDYKPNYVVRKWLTGYGYKWYGPKSIWYTKYTDRVYNETKAYIEKLQREICTEPARLYFCAKCDAHRSIYKELDFTTGVCWVCGEKLQDRGEIQYRYV